MQDKGELQDLILRENKGRRQEHFDNIAYVILGTLEITEDYCKQFVVVSLQDKGELQDLILRENKGRGQEHFDNIAYVILGTLEITEDEREYILALDEKYDALRERVIVMGLRDEKGVEWKRSGVGNIDKCSGILSYSWTIFMPPA